TQVIRASGQVTAPRSGSLFGQRPGEKSNPVAVKDQVDVGCTVPSTRKNVAELLEVGDRVQVPRRLLGAEPAVQIAADPGMARAAGQLAHMVDVIGGGSHADH